MLQVIYLANLSTGAFPCLYVYVGRLCTVYRKNRVVIFLATLNILEKGSN